MYYFKDAISLVLNHFSKVSIIVLTVLLPLNLAYMISSMLIFIYLEYTDPVKIMLFLVLFLMFHLVQHIPFINFVRQEIKVGEIRLKEVYKSFFRLLIPVLLYAVIYGVLVVIGINLLVIPGLLLFFALYLFPFSMGLENKGWLNNLKHTWNLGFKHLGKLIINVSLLWGGLLVVGSLLFALIEIYTQNIYLLMLFQAGLLSIFLPIFTVNFSYLYNEWFGEIEAEKEEERLIKKFNW